MYEPGWYRDPWGRASWRWWDGAAWTLHTSGHTLANRASSSLTTFGDPTREVRRPRLPAWLSPPVLVCGVIMVLLVGALVVTAPLAVALGFVPVAVVLPVLSWLDRVEPEPRSAKVHAVLWGACVATLVSLVLNTIVAAVTSEVVAIVASAPIVEEATKALGIWWAVRRKQVDGVMDGVVYAGLVALGFAVVEDFLYFAQADEAGSLVGVFILRGLLTPFAHPLFTAWIGMAIGAAIRSGRSPGIAALGGYILAVATHAAWNGALVWSEDRNDPTVVIVAAIGFVVLFVTVATVLTRLRRAEQRTFERLAPVLAQRYGLPPHEVMVFSSWRPMLAARRALPRENRARFDRVHAALGRLAALHDRPGAVDPVAEEVLVAQLKQARH